MDDWKYVFDQMTEEERKDMTVVMLKISSDPKHHSLKHYLRSALAYREPAPLTLKLLRLTAALSAIIWVGFSVMRENPYLGMEIILAYSSTVAVYAIYSTLQVRLSRRAYWVGE